jgi:hypothetical protein
MTAVLPPENATANKLVAPNDGPADQVVPAIRGTNVIAGEPGPPGPSPVRALIVTEYGEPLVKPVMMNGDETSTWILHVGIVAQFDVETLPPCCTQSQYSVPDAWVHEIDALVSPATTLTSAGAGADFPPPHPASSTHNAIDTTPRIRFI